MSLKFSSGPCARVLALLAAIWVMPAAGAAQAPVVAVGLADAPPPLAATQVPVLPTQPWLNGLSAIDTPDGQRFTALSNFGYVIEGRLERNAAGQLTGLRPEHARPLVFADGRPLTNGFRAAEGLAVAPDGRLFISFEYHTRVWTYRTADARPEDLGAHRDFERLPNGRGLASLALARDGSLYAIPERPARMTHGFPSYRWANGEWVGSFRMPSDGSFLPVGADFGPDGLLYVLEHSTGAGHGGQSQIRRFPVQGDRMGRGELVMRSAPGQFGYLAGVSIWRDRSGRLIATMVADNGGMADRPGALVEVVLAR